MRTESPANLRSPPHQHHHGDASAERYRTAWLAEASCPVVLVLTDLSVVWANGQARELEQAGVISLEGGSLFVRDARTTAGLLSFVNSVLASPSAWVAHELEDGHLLVRGEPMQPVGWPVGAALTFRMTSATDDYVLWADMRETLGLTKAEIVIVKRLLSGERAEDIAANSAASIETVRTHIRRIYLKLNVGTREQLFARILPFRWG